VVSERPRKLNRRFEEISQVVGRCHADKPLTHCTDRQIGELMNCIKDRLDIFDPEMAVCHHAKRRLLRSACVGVQSKSTDREAGGE